MDEVSPLARRCYAISESHLGSHRLILGFETIEDVQAAHAFLATHVSTNVGIEPHLPAQGER